MKYSKIILCMTVFMCLALQACAQSEDPLSTGSSGSTIGSSGDYISPNMGVSSGTNDPGLAGMLNWLNEPVPSFPWYSSEAAF